MIFDFDNRGAWPKMDAITPTGDDGAQQASETGRPIHRNPITRKHRAMTQPLVFIDGDQGTTGLQIHERLQGRDDLRLLTLPAAERKDAARRRRSHQRLRYRHPVPAGRAGAARRWRPSAIPRCR